MIMLKNSALSFSQISKSALEMNIFFQDVFEDKINQSTTRSNFCAPQFAIS